MTSSQICVNSGNVELILQLPESRDGIVKFLKNFGNLYVGNISSSFFKTTFQYEKTQLLNWILNHQIQDGDDYGIGHKIDLCYQALDSRWRSPCTATVVESSFFWESGLSRLLAGGLCWKDPWKEHLLLISSSQLQYVQTYLENIKEIDSDQDLINLLGNDAVSYFRTSLSINKNKQISFRLGSIKKKVSEHDYLLDTEIRVDTVRNWLINQPSKPKLHVYTNKPELVKDSIDFWDIKYCGFVPGLDSPSNIDSYLRQTPPAAGCYELYVQDSDTIDVAELLIWMDMDYTDYHTQDWHCVLRRHSDIYRRKIIGLSRSCVVNY